MGSIYQDDTAILKCTSVRMKQKLIEFKRYIKIARIIVGDLSMSISIINRTHRLKISKDTENMNNTIVQLIYL